MKSINFRGSISGQFLTVTRMLGDGKILPGHEIQGCGIADGTRIGGQFRGGDGREGIYFVSPQDQSTPNIVITAHP